MADRSDLIPAHDLAMIRAFAASRSPARVAHLVRIEVDVKGRAATRVECRAPWSSRIGPEWTRFPIARMRFNASTSRWTLYWRDRHQRFHEYRLIRPSRDIGVLLAEISADPTSIFCG